MKFTKAKMFNRKASDPRGKPDQVFKALDLKPGQNIVDIGAGGGYYSLRFAETVGEKGRVYAVDTSQELVEAVKLYAKEKGLGNVKTVLAAEGKLDLPEKSADWIFMRNVCHHLSDRVKYFKKLEAVLKPDGKVAVIDYKKTKSFNFHRIFGHYVLQETIVKEMEEAGYRLEKSCDFLPEQSFTIFTLSSSQF